MFGVSGEAKFLDARNLETLKLSEQKQDSHG
jgi:hypothetical protein